MPNATEFAGFLDGLRTQWDGVGQWLYFKTIFDFIDSEIRTFQGDLLDAMLRWVGGGALVLLTLWVLWKGYRVAQGKAGNPTALVVDGARAALIVTAATTLTLFHADLYTLLTDTLPGEITRVMTGRDKPALAIVDDSLSTMQAAMVGIDALNVHTSSENLKTDMDRAAWLAGMGTMGPAVMGGALLVMYKVALALFVGFAPLFILCLLLKPTQALFQKWLLHGVGTLFAQGVLAFAAVLMTKIVVAVGGVFAAYYVAAASTGLNPVSVSSAAMLQGGIGLMLTLVLVTMPTMAMAFFGGTLGSFTGFSVFGAAGGGGRRRQTQAAAPPPQDPSAREAHPTVDYARWMPPTQTVHADEIKRLATPDSADGSFTQRYPDALASNEAVGGGISLDALNNRTGATENLPPPIDGSLEGSDISPALLSVLDRVDRENLTVQSGQATFNAEGNDNPNSPHFSRSLHWPGGASGVTLGRGYDMRHRSKTEVYADLVAAGVDSDSAQNFSRGAGLSGDAARDFVRTRREEFGEISRSAQRRLFEDVVYPRYEQAARRQYDAVATATPGAASWDQLDSRIREVAVDLTDQQGSVWRRQMPYVLGNDREAFAQYVEATPELSRYEPGRHRADYLRGELPE